jgi:transcription termination/antitermination protein NusG
VLDIYEQSRSNALTGEGSMTPRSATGTPNEDMVNSTGPEGHAQWFALWTHSHCEQLVHDQLIAKGLHPLLPMTTVWSRRAGVRNLIRLPMFPSYLFLRHAMDKYSYIEILKTRGLTRILGERWDRLAVIADAEIEAIQRVVSTNLPVLPHPYLCKGQRVRISDGPLTGVEGILVHIKPNKGHLVLSVDLLQRSVAVEVDCTLVTPIGAAPIRHGAA